MRRAPIENALYIDPGLDGTGWSYWETLAVFQHGTSAPYSTGSIGRVKGGADMWVSRVHAQCELLVEDLRESVGKIDYIGIEFPGLWAGDAVSYASTSSGDLFKLAFMVGALAECLSRTYGPTPELFSPQEWKGQLSKTQVNQRIERAIKKSFPNHVSDAVGMGLAAAGLL